MASRIRNPILPSTTAHGHEREPFPDSKESGVVIDAFDRGSQVGMALNGVSKRTTNQLRKFSGTPPLLRVVSRPSAASR